MSITLPRFKTQHGAAYLDSGHGEVLLLLHGVGLRLEAWRPQVDVFSKSHRLIIPDLPGHGESKALPQDAMLEDFVAWVITLMDDLDIEKVNIAGHSMGALIAGGVVATVPERVIRVGILSGVFLRPDGARDAVVDRAREFAEGNIDPQKPLQRWFSDEERQSEAYNLTQWMLGQVKPEGYAVAYNAFAHGDSRYANDWQDIHCPALFLTGTEDPNSTAEMACEMAAQAPDGMLRLIEGHRHMVSLTAVQKVNEALEEWLSKE